MMMFRELNDSGLFGWLGTKGKLHRLEHELLLGEFQHHYRWGRHFLYTSNGPSLVQVLFGDSTGGKLVAGKVKISKVGQLPHSFSKGEIIEIKIKNPSAARRELLDLVHALHLRHLAAAPVGEVVSGSGTPDLTWVPGHRPAGRVARLQRPQPTAITATDRSGDYWVSETFPGPEPAP